MNNLEMVKSINKHVRLAIESFGLDFVRKAVANSNLSLMYVRGFLLVTNEELNGKASEDISETDIISLIDAFEEAISEELNSL